MVIGHKAFKDDFATRDYETSGKVLVVNFCEDIDDNYKESITKNVLIMLQINHSLRPSAANLCHEFSSNFDSIRVESNDTVQIHEILPGTWSSILKK
jgi:hypothetical protein